MVVARNRSMAHSQSVGLVRKSTGDIINTVAPVKIPVAIQLAMSPKSWYSGIQFSATSAGWRPPKMCIRDRLDTTRPYEAWLKEVEANIAARATAGSV